MNTTKLVFCRLTGSNLNVSRTDSCEAWRESFSGLLHRKGGPAKTIFFDSGASYEYFYFGDRHRVGGPAVIHANGSEEYYLNGKRHRLDGPACSWASGRVEYWIHGVQYSLVEFSRKRAEIEAEENEKNGYPTSIVINGQKFNLTVA